MKQRHYSRTGWLAIILLGTMAVFVLRLFQLQIIQHDTYVARAKQSQQRQFTIPAKRGTIYMMDGREAVPVVLNQTVYTMIADPQTVESSQRGQIVTTLRQVAGGEMASDVEQKLNNTASRYEVLARQLTRQQAETLKQKDFAGILYQPNQRRSYPEGQLGAHVLGFVNAEGKGQYGVEGGLDEQLRGQDGVLRSVTDVRNVPLTIGRDNVRIEPKSGQNTVLSIDRTVQSFVEESLRRGIEKAAATEGSALVMNPNNGRVLAMANYPTYSPAEYGKVTDARAFMNNVTMTPFEPASVIKTFIMAAGIDRGVVTPQSTYNNTNCTKVVDRTMCNATLGLAGPTTMQSVINNSLNVGTIHVARQLGGGNDINQTARQIMYQYYHDKFGFGEPTGIEVAEAPGHVYAPDSEQGNEVRYATMTFGQGLNLTMAQVAAGFCSVINGGQYFRPTLVYGTMNDDGTLSTTNNPSIRQTVSQQTSSQMRTMLQTARQSVWLGKSDKPGYTIGGKTGTAETITNGQYTKKETVATYVGYGGREQPEYVIMIRVAAPGKGLNLEGGLHAGPIFTDISNQMIDYMKLAPKG